MLSNQRDPRSHARRCESVLVASRSLSLSLSLSLWEELCFDHWEPRAYGRAETLPSARFHWLRLESAIQFGAIHPMRSSFTTTEQSLSMTDPLLIHFAREHICCRYNNYSRTMAMSESIPQRTILPRVGEPASASPWL